MRARKLTKLKTKRPFSTAALTRLNLITCLCGSYAVEWSKKKFFFLSTSSVYLPFKLVHSAYLSVYTCSTSFCWSYIGFFENSCAQSELSATDMFTIEARSWYIWVLAAHILMYARPMSFGAFSQWSMRRNERARQQAYLILELYCWC